MADQPTLATVPLSRIEVDPTIQIRHGNHEQTIQRYMEAFDKLPRVEVFDTTRPGEPARGQDLLLADGFHRIAAAVRLGRGEIDVVVHRGTREDALEFAVISNTKNADPLTPEERDAGIRRLKQIHPDWSNRRIADEMSVSETTIRRVFDIDEVKQATFRGASADAPSDFHYREIARAPREQWQPLVDATQARGWSGDITALAVRNLRDDRIPHERRRAILAGEADPVVVTPDGQLAVPAEVIGRQIREMQANDAVLALERSFEALARLRLFRPEAIVGSMDIARLHRLIDEMPGYISFMEEVLEAAKHGRRPEVLNDDRTDRARQTD